MIANYGFEDGSGEYYIRIDTAKCKSCNERKCVDRCPGKIFVLDVDDWDDEIVIVKKDKCNLLNPSVQNANRSETGLNCFPAKNPVNYRRSGIFGKKSYGRVGIYHVYGYGVQIP